MKDYDHTLDECVRLIHLDVHISRSSAVLLDTLYRYTKPSPYLASPRLATTGKPAA